MPPVARKKSTSTPQISGNISVSFASTIPSRPHYSVVNNTGKTYSNLLNSSVPPEFLSFSAIPAPYGGLPCRDSK